MEIIPISENIDSISFTLPIYSSIKIGKLKSKNNDEFTIFAGINEKFIEELKSLSRDESDIELQENTSDKKRFWENPFESWYLKNRTPFTLVHTKTNTLAAIVWFGPKPLGRKSLKHLTEKELKEDESKVDSENWHTISYRCYPIFRGQGLMKYFVNFVMNIYLKKFPQIKIWAGINIKNKASEALARRLGFRIVEESSDPENNWLVMIKD